VSDTVTILAPWVARLDSAVCVITVREGAPTEPPLGEVSVTASTRDEATMELAELIDAGTVAADRTVNWIVTAHATEALASVARLGVKRKPPSPAMSGVMVPSSAVEEALPEMGAGATSAQVVRLTMGHAHLVTKLLVESHKHLLDSYTTALVNQTAATDRAMARVELIEKRLAESESMANDAMALLEKSSKGASGNDAFIEGLLSKVFAGKTTANGAGDGAEKVHGS
jgi:hypothetical protein